MRQQWPPDRLGVGPHGPVHYPGGLRRIIIDGQHPCPDTVAWSFALSRQDTQTTMNRVTLGGLACGLTLLLTACTSGGLSDNGPFGNFGQNSGTLCQWARPGGVLQDGFEEFNDAGGNATIDKVVLVHPRHLRLIAAWVGEGDSPIGDLGRGYPHPTMAWKHVPGAVVHHTRGQQVINVVIVVRPSGKLGTATAVDLYYKSGGTRYLLHFPYGLQVPVGHKCD